MILEGSVTTSVFFKAGTGGRALLPSVANHSPVSRSSHSVLLCMRTSFPSATLRSHGSQSGGERAGSRYHEPSVPHIYSEASVVHRFHRMLLSLGKDRVSVQLCFGCFAISDRPSSPSFPVHSLFRHTRTFRARPWGEERRGGKFTRFLVLQGPHM